MLKLKYIQRQGCIVALLVLVSVFIINGLVQTYWRTNLIVSHSVLTGSIDVSKTAAKYSMGVGLSEKALKGCWIGSKNCVRIFDTSVDYSNASQIYLCVYQKVPTIPNAKICIYDPLNDIYISESIVSNGNWEGALIGEVLNILRTDQNMQFLDLGCNIGVYTISVATLGRRVTALDANRKNLEMLTTSLQMGNLTGNVTLLWNALSDRSEVVTFKEDAGNVGGMEVVSGQELEVDIENSSIAVTLDDLVDMFRNKTLFIKMDIEKYEMKALSGAKQFFKRVNIRYLLMEWMHHATSQTGLEIIQFLSERGFAPYAPHRNTSQLRPEARMKWPNDVLWKKTDRGVTERMT